MSARERAYRAMRAAAEGAAAFNAGKPMRACPYKVSNWGAGVDWQMGWERAKNAVKHDTPTV